VLLHNSLSPTIRELLFDSSNMNKEKIVEKLKSQVSTELDGLLGKLTQEASLNADHWKTALAQRQLKQFVTTLLELSAESQLQLLQLQTKIKEVTEQSEIAAKDNHTLMTTLDTLNTAAIAYPIPLAIKTTSNSKPFHKLLELYQAEKKSVLKIRTFTQLQSTLTRFIEIIGYETESHKLCSDDIDKYCLVIRNIPPNFKLNREGMPPIESAELSMYWVECANSNKGKKLATNGAEKHFTAVRTFLKWCHDRHATNADYSNVSILRKAKRVDDAIERVPFSIEQLNQIFTSRLYKREGNSKRIVKDHEFWLPLIALYSGMRIAEIVGLERVDIRQVEDTWVFDVNEHWKFTKSQNSCLSKSKKNKSSVRLIPICEQLINIGFLNYIDMLKKDDMLFPELSLGKDKGLGDYASKWFNGRFLDQIQLEKRSADGKQSVTFHSFRHGFVTNIDKAEFNGNVLNDSERHYITGHEQEGVRNKTYNHSGVNISRLKTFVDAIDFGIDLSAIKYK
jgi:integrase